MSATAIMEAVKDVTGGLNEMKVGLERVQAGFNTLRGLLIEGHDAEEFDPSDPANKHEIGGVMKLTPRAVEGCYRLFDAGKTRYAVASAMGISFGAATHRWEAWKKLGGVNRTKQPLNGG
jgi:hypothetical protein